MSVIAAFFFKPHISIFNLPKITHLKPVQPKLKMNHLYLVFPHSDGANNSPPAKPGRIKIMEAGRRLQRMNTEHGLL